MKKATRGGIFREPRQGRLILGSVDLLGMGITPLTGLLRYSYRMECSREVTDGTLGSGADGSEAGGDVLPHP